MFETNTGKQRTAEHAEWGTRLQALNPSTPVENLTKLSRSKSTRVRAAVASNPTTAATVLLHLSNDRSWEVRAAVAGNDNIPQQLFTRLADDPEDWVKVNLARNPNTPLDVFIKMMDKPTPDIREAVISTLVSISDSQFKKKLKESGLIELVDLPREWAVKALFA